MVQAGARGRDLFVSGLCYCHARGTSGVIPSAALTLLTDEPRVQRLALTLVDIGLWSFVPVGFKVEDFDRWCVPPPLPARTPLRGHVSRLARHWGRQCAYCGSDATFLEVEHIIPRARGGSDDLTNLTLACTTCNRKKGTRTAEEFGFPEMVLFAGRIQ